MPETSLRRLQADDAAAHRALMLAAYAREPGAFTSTVAERASLPLAWWTQRLGPGAAMPAVWGAWDGARLVGAAGLSGSSGERSAHLATLFGMVVEPAWRGRGLGRALVQAVLAHARAQPGLRVLQLTVSDDNEAACRLYERCGFNAFGVQPMAVALDDGRFIAKRHMACVLPAPDWRFSWDDSELAAVEPAADGWRLRFAAAQVARRDAEGRWQPGHLAPVVAHLRTVAALEGGDLLGRLGHGRLITPEGPRGTLPLPFSASGALRLELQPGRGDAMVLALDGLQIGAPPQALWRPSLAC